MIVYQSTKSGFASDVLNGVISDKIEEAFIAHLGRHTSPNEVRSWENSMQYMDRVVSDPEIPSDSSISIEYQLPLASKRIDFIIAGRDENDASSVVIVELKQWQSAKKTEKDGVVITRFEHGEQETTHPSYQAWSYSAMLRDYNSAIQDGEISLHPCAYLHNYDDDGVISSPFYGRYLEEAPAFFSHDALKLRDFIKRFVRKGDNRDILYSIENGRLRPSKHLADCLASMLKGNEEFKLLDDQKTAYETALALSDLAKPDLRQVLIIEGGPGSGKSVLAVNLLVELTKRGLVARYVSKNSAPRMVYSRKLAGDFRAVTVENMFGGTGCFFDLAPCTFDVLIVDEAHRLCMKSGMYQNLGEDQTEEIVRASKMSVFFIDEHQRISMQDVGSIEKIKKAALKNGARITQLSLSSQFRCNGSDGYLNWIDNLLQIRDTANVRLTRDEYDFRVFDDPVKMFEAIREKNESNNKSRVVAGYCWDWVSKSDKSRYDIVIGDRFRHKWNLTEDGQAWIIQPESINEIGCIHTCQGLELDYVGVIVGDDLRYENGRVVTDVLKHPGRDRAMQGIRGLMKHDPEKAAATARELITNTYRVLMTRGQKGCFVYFCDSAMASYVRSLLVTAQPLVPPVIAVTRPRVEPDIAVEARYRDYLPYYSIRAACGYFGDGEEYAEEGWVRADSLGRLNRNMFVVQARGKSMEPRISDGDYCAFSRNVGGSREGKIVLVQHFNTFDPDYVGSFSIKRYHSVKNYFPGDLWSHERIELQPLNNEYKPIVLEEQDAYDGFRILGEFVGVVE